jgi:hypothetical protein
MDIVETLGIIITIEIMDTTNVIDVADVRHCTRNFSVNTGTHRCH